MLLRKGDKKGSILRGFSKGLIGCRKGNRYYLCQPSRVECILACIEIVDNDYTGSMKVVEERKKFKKSLPLSLPSGMSPDEGARILKSHMSTSSMKSSSQNEESVEEESTVNIIKPEKTIEDTVDTIAEGNLGLEVNRDDPERAAAKFFESIQKSSQGEKQ